MAKYRDRLPQLGGAPLLTDGGMETTLIFHEGIDLPHFASFDLLKDEAGREVLRAYYRRFARIARRAAAGFLLEGPTWRANPDWGAKLGYDAAALDEANHQAIDLMHELRDELETPSSPIVLSGCVGPRGDGYDPGAIMSPEEAAAYHARQIGVFARSGADMIGAMTITNVNEAVGIVRAARGEHMPVAISFTVETDGRIRGVRANASRCSHAELDEAVELDDGNPAELGAQYPELRRRHPHINVLGGCCGTDHRHILEIATAFHEMA